MKKKVEKSKNGKPSMPFKKTTELSQQMDEDKKVYNLRVAKKKESKDEVCKSTKTAPRNLRTRIVKNNSKTLKVVKFKTEEKKVNENSPTIIDNKKIPIYKTIELVKEKVQNPEEIYEFINDSPVSDQKVKKKKKYRKPPRKPLLKQAKKLSGMHYNGSQKTKTKPTKTVSKSVQLKKQKKLTSTKPEQNLKYNVYANINNAGNSTNAEASTIVISNQKLQQSASTSPVVSPLNTEESMSDHSLIRQSMSPISKVGDNLLIESPRRSTDSFSQVQNVVQSTPQINRLLAGQEKKSLVPINLNKKSIDSQGTIHLSSVTDEKFTSQNMSDITQIQKDNVSPRKFGTVMSNLNSVKNGTTTLKQSSLQQKQQSPMKAVLSPSSFEDYQHDQEMQNNILPESSILTADNRKVSNSLSPNKLLKMKIDQIFSPLKFENIIQSFKQIVSSVPKSNGENSKSQKENKNPELVAGPSNYEKPRAIVLRQSNLNNFLNLDEMPARTRISTAHGIFDDGNNSPINGKKAQTVFDESNIENEFGLGNCVYSERSSPIKKTSVPIIATARDVARSVKGKLFVKARVKSSLTRRVSENMTKKTLLKNILKKTVPELKAPINEEIVKENEAVHEKSKNKCLTNNVNERSKSLMNEKEKNINIEEDQSENVVSFMEDQNENVVSFMEDQNENIVSFMEDENENYVSFMEDENEKNAGHTEDESEKNSGHTEDESEKNAGHTDDEIIEKNTNSKSTENVNVSLDPKKAYLDAISFSDTFDFLSENGDDINSKLPDEIPIFFDLEPVHFSQPPRRSYNKRKKAVCFNPSRVDSESECSEEDECNKPKKKRKRASRLNKEENKRMQQWIDSVNEQFNEIEQFNLTIE